MEKSLEGLLRSMLVEILSAEPAAADALVEELAREEIKLPAVSRLANERLDTQRLLKLLEHLVQPGLLKNKFCLFIDGVDEYDGSPQNMCDLINSIALANNVKICASSRPWNQFEAAFGSDVERKLAVHVG